MERLLWLYALPYDRHYPVVCFDERPCFLIGEELDPLPLQSGQIRKEHYAYKEHFKPMRSAGLGAANQLI